MWVSWRQWNQLRPAWDSPNCFSQRSLQLSPSLQYSHPPWHPWLYPSLAFLSFSIHPSSKMTKTNYRILAEEERGWYWWSLFPFPVGFPGPCLCNGSLAVPMERVAEWGLRQKSSPNAIQGTKLSRGKKIKFLAFCFVLACRQPQSWVLLGLMLSHILASQNHRID